jgi:hypothetical protein
LRGRRRCAAVMLLEGWANPRGDAKTRGKAQRNSNTTDGRGSSPLTMGRAAETAEGAEERGSEVRSGATTSYRGPGNGDGGGRGERPRGASGHRHGGAVRDARSCVGRRKRLMPHRFWTLGIPRKWWGGPPGPRARALVPLSEQQHQHLAGSSRPTGASAADQGVRPTIYAECAVLGKLCGIRRKRLPHFVGRNRLALRQSAVAVISRGGSFRGRKAHYNRAAAPWFPRAGGVGAARGPEEDRYRAKAQRRQEAP